MMRAIGGVLIEGPKACGKSETAKQVAQTIHEFDRDDAAREAVALNPDSLFTGKPPILFDEWQLEPSIWNRVRRQVDERHSRGDFILTGSARPRDDVSRHSGAGRIGVLHMRPMSLFESGHSTGEVSSCRPVERRAPTGTGDSPVLRRVARPDSHRRMARDHRLRRTRRTSMVARLPRPDRRDRHAPDGASPQPPQSEKALRLPRAQRRSSREAHRVGQGRGWRRRTHRARDDHRLPRHARAPPPH